MIDGREPAFLCLELAQHVQQLLVGGRGEVQVLQPVHGGGEQGEGRVSLRLAH